MEARLELTAQDTQPTVINCRNNNIAVPITSYSISLKVKLNGSTLTKSAVITDAVNGVAEFRWLDTDLTTSGSFPSELVITNASGQIVTSERFTVIVKDRL